MLNFWLAKKLKEMGGGGGLFSMLDFISIEMKSK